MSFQTAHIAIDVRIDEDEISGHAGDGVSEPRPFSGWVGLIGLLDGLLRKPRTGGEEPPVRACVAFATAAEAEAFAASSAVREAVREAGATGDPEIWESAAGLTIRGEG